MDGSTQGRTGKAGQKRDAGILECEGELPGFRPGHAANDTHMPQLFRTIEQEIIPRLMLAHRHQPEAFAHVSPAQPLAEGDVKQFAKLVLSHDEDVAFHAIQALRARGVSVESIYVDLLAPTARHLGELWEEDLCDFTDVTVGLGRLQRVLRELSSALGHSVEHASLGRRVLLLPSPAEQHTFGLVMVAEFFRRSGWDVTGGAWAAGADAAQLVAAEWFDVVGFSLGSETHLQALTQAIAAVRQASCNQHIAIMVGGPMFGANPLLVAEVGADGTTSDGREAPALAEQMVAASVASRAPTLPPQA